MTTWGSLGTAGRVGALLLIATGGLFCSSGGPSPDPTPTPDPFTASLAVPRHMDQNVSVSVTPEIESVWTFTAAATGCVEVVMIQSPYTAYATTTSIDATGHRLVVGHATPFLPDRGYTVTLKAGACTAHSPTSTDSTPVPSHDMSWMFSTIGLPTTALDCGAPHLIDSPISGMTIDVAGDGAGFGIALCWYEEATGVGAQVVQHIEAVPVNAGTVGTVQRLVEDAGDRGPPAIAMNASGEAIAAGPYLNTAPVTPVSAIWYAAFDGTTWGSVSSISKGVHDPVKDVQTGIAANGDGIVAYLAGPTAAIDHWHIEYRLLVGGTWGGIVDITPGIDLAELGLAMNADGDVLLVAVEDAGGLRLYCVGGSEETIAPTAGSTASQVQVAMNPDGKAFLVWREVAIAGGDSRIRAATTLLCDAPVVRFLDEDAGVPVMQPAIATGPGDTAIAVWARRDGVGANVARARGYTAGVWDATATTAISSPYAVSDTSVAISPVGLISVVAANGEAAYLSTKAGTGAWAAPKDVSTDPAATTPLCMTATHVFVTDTAVLAGFITTNFAGIMKCGLTQCSEPPP